MYEYRSLILSFMVVCVMVLCTIMGIDQLMREDGNDFLGTLLLLSPWLTMFGIICH